MLNCANHFFYLHAHLQCFAGDGHTSTAVGKSSTTVYTDMSPSESGTCMNM